MLLFHYILLLHITLSFAAAATAAAEAVVKECFDTRAENTPATIEHKINFE